jgi:hypothetical protein
MLVAYGYEGCFNVDALIQIKIIVLDAISNTILDLPIILELWLDVSKSECP